MSMCRALKTRHRFELWARFVCVYVPASKALYAQKYTLLRFFYFFFSFEPDYRRVFVARDGEEKIPASLIESLNFTF